MNRLVLWKRNRQIHLADSLSKLNQPNEFGGYEHTTNPSLPKYKLFKAHIL